MRAQTYPPLPSSLKLGTTVCFGAFLDCQKGNVDHATAIELAAFVGFDALNPTRNYALLMVSDFTLDTVVSIFSKGKRWEVLWGSVPQKIRGIKLSGTECEGHQEASSLLANNESIVTNFLADLDDPWGCFARASYNAGPILELPGTGVQIPHGVGLNARLDIGGWSVAVDAKISQLGLFIDAEMDAISLGSSILQIGGTCTCAL